MPKIKSTECYTKYKWRSDVDASDIDGPIVLATQLVSEYLTQDGDRKCRAKGRPVTIYTYSMEFYKVFKKDENFFLIKS